ncbi:MAG: TraB/GumN family protein [Nanoarchaeota archaeon]|nr:TraB/GumN family protein [Nanoarchaeota archaeon]
MIEKIDNIILLGTSHVAKQSAKEIEETIELYKPEVVGIELDIDRLKTLLSEKKDANKKRRNNLKMIKEIGFSGYIFALIAGLVQDKVGKSLGIEAGIDMKTAYVSSREKKIPIALIDLNIKYTLKKLSSLSFRKKISLFSSLFFKSFKKEYRNKLQFDVKNGVPDEKVIAQMLKIVEKEIPQMYKILIHDRNLYMSKKLLELREAHNGNILAVVGAGHLEGMKKYLKENIGESKTKIPDLDENSLNVSYIMNDF